MIVSIVLPALSGSPVVRAAHGEGSPVRGRRCELHLAEFEVALDVGQRLDDRGEQHREQARLDQFRNHELPPSGSTSSGAKYRNLPWLRCISAAGSSSGTSAR